MKNNTPLRTCVGCGTEKSKKELVRIIRDKDGNVSLDRTGKMNGRGAYICDNPECLENAIKRRSLIRSLKVEIENDILDSLRMEIKGDL